MHGRPNRLSARRQASVCLPRSSLGEGKRAAFFINGRLIFQRQPLEALVRIIDDELSRDVAVQSGAR
jgi:hypothetical protein